MKIFIVESSKLLRDQLIKVLSGINGVEISGCAVSAPEAIAKIRAHKPDVVILDVLIPGGGIETIKKIKEEKVTVFVLTNFSYSQYRRVCQAAGADYFFDKSVEFTRFIQTIDNLYNRITPAYPVAEALQTFQLDQ